MGVFKNILIELQNRYPNDADYGMIFRKFTTWLHDKEENKVFDVSFKPGTYTNLKTNRLVTVEEVLEYWLDNVHDNNNTKEG